MSEESLASPLRLKFDGINDRFDRRFHWSKSTIDMFLVLASGAFVKNLDFNLMVNKAPAQSSYFFLSPALRGLCEELITLSYLSGLPDAERAEICSAYWQRSFATGLTVQRAFFDQRRPDQLLYDHTVDQTAGTISSSEKTLRRYAKKYLWGDRIFPTTGLMARRTGLRELYDFVYHATSRIVHFEPQTILRMMWGDVAVEEATVEISASHFASYYEAFSTFYGALLFTHFVDQLGATINLDRKIVDASLNIKQLLEDWRRWTELVTYEEVNSRPNLIRDVTLKLVRRQGWKG